MKSSFCWMQLTNTTQRCFKNMWDSYKWLSSYFCCLANQCALGCFSICVFPLCPSHPILQFTDSLTAETTLSEVRVGQFFLPFFHRWQVGTDPSTPHPHTPSVYLISPRCLPSHTTLMTDKSEVTSWSQALVALIAALQEMAPDSLHRSDYVKDAFYRFYGLYWTGLMG